MNKCMKPQPRGREQGQQHWQGGGPWCNRPAGASTRSPPASVAPEDPWARAATCGPAGSHPAPPCLVPNQAPVLAGACPVRGVPWAARGPWCTVVLCGARSRCVVHGHGHGCTVVVRGARRVVFVPGPRPAGRARCRSQHPARGGRGDVPRSSRRALAEALPSQLRRRTGTSRQIGVSAPAARGREGALCK